MDFKTYIENHANKRGEEAKAELAKLTKKFPEYANEKLYAKNFPVVYGRFQAYVARKNAKPRVQKMSATPAKKKAA